ncbi:hypothetical protein HYT23_00825 [Candidatus Pacearchaeota archaeon]|nr:hypothetical protein [Candidatus Pacearchaeota archaeon]
MQEKENIKRILEGTIKKIKNYDVVGLRELSNQTIHTASITQDPDNIAIAVIVYALSKILERPDYRQRPGWNKFYKGLINEIEHAIYAIGKQDDAHLRFHIERIAKKLDSASGKLKKYIREVIIKAKVNKASRIYEHGISMEKTAKLLGITMWELAGYVGQTGIPDVNFAKTMDIKDRIKIAEEIFK